MALSASAHSSAMCSIISTRGTRCRHRSAEGARRRAFWATSLRHGGRRRSAPPVSRHGPTVTPHQRLLFGYVVEEAPGAAYDAAAEWLRLTAGVAGAEGDAIDALFLVTLKAEAPGGSAGSGSGLRQPVRSMTQERLVHLVQNAARPFPGAPDRRARRLTRRRRFCPPSTPYQG